MTDRILRRAVTRRELLRHGGRVAASLPVLALAATMPRFDFALHALAAPPGPAPLDPAPTRAGEWVAGGGLRAFAASEWDSFVADFPFGALGAHWVAGAGADDTHLQVSLSPDGVDWSPWRELHPDDHGRSADDERRFAELLLASTSQHVRFRATGPDGEPRPLPPDLRLVYIDASGGPSAADLGAQLGAFEATMPRVVPRSGWGADEKLRFDKAGKEIWKPEYYITEKIIIHHTETSNTEDPLKAIRSVYYYHAVTRGWGDIGYNYLIDRNGVVYEGRYGGPNVVGGHAYQYNYGSLGIALLGSFTTTPDTPAAEASLIQLAAYKGRFINPQGTYYFVDKTVPNIIGHRDVLSTACPGNAFYPRLPTIRQGVAGIIGTAHKIDVAVTGVSNWQLTIPIGTPVVVKVTVKNTGTAMVPSYYDKGLSYTEGESYESKGKPKVQGRFRIVADVVTSSTTGTPLANPYRWGFGRSLEPGETVEVQCRIAFKTVGERKLRFGLIQEFVGYKQENLEGPTITVIGKPTDPVKRPENVSATLMYFPETGHTLRGAFLRYWDKFGGLAQFGYPLTEEFSEINEDDGEPYTVQYFERARFEYHPENKGTDYEVLLGLVGRLFHDVDPPAQPINRPDVVYFKQTGHNLGGAFRYYWEQYGGLFVYGYPITEEFREKSRIDGKEYTVQYFERARFEFHPENTGKSQVLLGHLGRQMLQERGWLVP